MTPSSPHTDEQATPTLAQPTAAALRAARTIVENNPSLRQAPSCTIAHLVDAKARLIDRETGLPELLYALESAHAMLRLMGVKLEDHEEGRRIIAALSKSERSTP